MIYSMNQLTLDQKNPISLFLQSAITTDERLRDRFMVMIRHLYQFQIFQPILDLTATKILEGRLSFKLHDQRFFDLDEGNCKTIYGGSINQLWNKIRSNNQYLITIKKLSYDVIIHEISHMIEKELDFNLLEFTQILGRDLTRSSNSVAMKKMIDQIMISEVNLYKESQRSSELFARYFQMLSMSKEISGLSIQGAYNLDQILIHFSYINEWIKSNLSQSFKRIINPSISNYSSHLIKNIEDVHHKWSEQKVNSIHNRSSERKWSKTVNSIKNDPFAE